MKSLCIKCQERPATHASVYGEKLCETCRRASNLSLDNPENFAVLAKRRKEAFDEITESLSEPIHFEPGKTYPNHMDAIFPDCPMCIFRPCTGAFLLGTPMRVRVGLTCGTAECIQAWAKLEGESNSKKRGKS